MNRVLFRSLGLALFAALLGAGSASATTYYIAANGSDSNNGTSKSSPWLHAPGMTGCSGTCASTTPQAGDSFILRGGDTWHYSGTAGSPVGLPWTWKWSGSAATCQLNAAAGVVIKTSCIYIGVDTTWSSGGSWTRPVLNLDNPVTNSRPSSCSFDDTTVNSVQLGGNNYLIFDNFEFVGSCWQGNANAAYLDSQGNMLELSNNYFHGWEYGSGSSADSYWGIGGAMPKSNYVLCDHNVFSNSDGSLGATVGQASGFSIDQNCKEIAFNVFSHVSNGFIANPASVHDNLFQFLYEPQGSVHGNIAEWDFADPTTGPLYFYNNIMHNTNEGEGVDFETEGGVPVYAFNNVSWHYRELAGANNPNASGGTNCFMADTNGSSGAAANYYFFNNTIDWPCNFNNTDAGGITSTVIFQNNHATGAWSPTNVNALSDGIIKVVDNGSEVFQTESAANSQGYTTTNNYAPTLQTDVTVGAGTSMANTICSTLANSVASAACENGIVSVSYDSINHAPVLNPLVSRMGGAWDASAYQYSGDSSDQPNPPTGLTAAVQ